MTPGDADGPPRSGDTPDRLADFEQELAAAMEAEDEDEDEGSEEVIEIVDDAEDDLDSEADTFRAAGLDPDEYRVEE